MLWACGAVGFLSPLSPGQTYPERLGMEDAAHGYFRVLFQPQKG